MAGQTLTKGTYSTADGTFSNSGTLTLDAQGDPNAVFIFQAASTVITSTGSTMLLTNGAQACNVYWQVGTSATLGVNSTFVGHIYAQTSITANTGATVYGQLLARDAAVTLDSNTIVNDACAAIVVTTTTATTIATTTTTTVTAVPASTTSTAPTTTVVPTPTTTVRPTTTTSASANIAGGVTQLPQTGNDDFIYGLVAGLIIAIGIGVLRRS